MMSALKTGILILLCGGFAACAAREAGELEQPPIITSATYQHTLYTGKPQPIEAEAARPGAPPFIITYFPGKDALERNEGGSGDAPSAVGAYYARIERPSGNGYAAGPDVAVEYYIQKAFVTIQAEEKQRALYDGSPKSVAAGADAPVPLVITYYPTAQKSGPGLGGPPIEAGVYHVTISWPGDDNYRPASKDVEFAIVNNN
ncbi:MAG: hypothetical protein LBQ57_00745 [Spirochaetales bacterium]|jgi:hypothetical protein|nr:hypothetical protein [Spirochaetales bacterium]